jgi:metallo-beta-lactamase class B
MTQNGYARFDPENPRERACSHPWEFYYEPFAICGNLYYVGNRRVSSHLIDTGDGLVLIDTAFASTTYLLLDAIARLGFRPKDVRHILHTHCHFDHIQGTRALVELYGCKTYVGENDLPLLKKQAALNMAESGSFGYFEEFEPDVLLRDGQTLTIGNTVIDVVETPGHSPGCLSYFFNVQADTKAYRAGLPGGLGLTPLKTALLQKSGLPLSARDDYRRSLEKLRGQRADIILGAHPHHNDMFPKREAQKSGEESNPFIASDWGAFLDGQVTAFDLFLAAEKGA